MTVVNSEIHIVFDYTKQKGLTMQCLPKKIG